MNGSGTVGCCFVLGMVQYRYCGWRLEIENGGYGPAESMDEDVTSGYHFVLESPTARQALMLVFKGGNVDLLFDE